MEIFKSQAVFIILIGILAAASYERNAVWKNDVSLWEDTTKKSPKKARGYNELGIAYSNRSRFDQAIKMFDSSISISLNILSSYNKQGRAIPLSSQYYMATEDLERAYYNRGTAYCIMGNFQGAVADFTGAIELNPENADAYNNRAIAYLRLGRDQEAASDLKIAAKLGVKSAAEMLK